MPYKLEEINRRVREDPQGFVAECDAAYEQNVEKTAQTIIKNMNQTHIILLSGPSGSGKTTTAKNIEAYLDNIGIETHTISIDNYFLDVDPLTTPRGADGGYDFESPGCLDIELLSKHFEELDKGNEIMIPKFEFSKQRRNLTRAIPLRLGKNELAIFEGIHALNDSVTINSSGRRAIKIYISARSDIESNGTIIYKGTWMRIVRRAIRDMQFRGASPAMTFRMWDNVRLGEKKYISPFSKRADIVFDSTLPYEVPALKNFTVSIFDGIEDTVPRYKEIMQIREAQQLFEALSVSYVPESSLLREFIGGGNHKY